MLNTTLPVLLKDGTVTQNTYQTLDSGLSGDVVLTVEQLEHLDEIDGKKALYLTVTHSPEDHQFPLAQLDTILIDFEGFNDGRGYSFATLLRRQGFKGELRAVGDIFKDTLNYLKRAGFDSFVLKEGKDIQTAIAGLDDFKQPYQISTANLTAHYQTGK